MLQFFTFTKATYRKFSVSLFHKLATLYVYEFFYPVEIELKLAKITSIIS